MTATATCPPNSKVERFLMLAKEKRRRIKQNAIELYSPYGFQRDFHNSSKDFLFCGMIAGNQVGKTFCGANNVTYHLTGQYPEWWKGRVFDHPTNWWAGSHTYETTKRGVHNKLLGDLSDPGNLGTGSIPAKYIHHYHKKSGVSDFMEYVLVRHKSGGFSKLDFKSYDQGIDAWQAETLSGGIWFDEEPPANIFSEGVTRIVKNGGLVVITATPVFGMTEVMRKIFEMNSKGEAKLVNATWEDAPHLDESAQDLLKSVYLPHELNARTKGIPALGSGMVYPVAEEVYVAEPFSIPAHYARIFGLDVGWKMTAGVWGAHDRDSDIVYIYSEYGRGQAEAPVHASAIKSRGDWIPGEIDPAARGRTQTDGKSLKKLYEKEGLILNAANNSVEAGVLEVFTRLQTGRLKIFSTCKGLLNEIRLYHRDEKGKIVKENDHYVDATRYMVMGIGNAKTEPVVVRRRPQTNKSWMSV